MICVIDYGMGNLRSVSKALEAVAKVRVIVSKKSRDILRADKVVLPGVGEFGSAMRELRQRKLIEPIHEVIQKQKPFLGICLGLQLLFQSSEESKGVAGLSILRGFVRKLSSKTLKIPHVGWNQVEFLRKSKLTAGVKNKSFFYFVHSYYGLPKEKSLIFGQTNYGTRFASILEEEPVFAVQFHPEKSQAAGLKILKNFVTY